MKESLWQQKAKGTLSPLGALLATFLPVMGISSTPGATSAAGTECGHCSMNNKSPEIDIGVPSGEKSH